MKLTRIILATVVLLAVAGAAFGQGERQRYQSKGGSSSDLSQYTVSAKAGAVNIAEGDIAYKRDQKDWDMLIAGDDLRSGDTVRTGPAGRAEILLNPGSYLRISENTEFVFTDTSLDNLKIELLRGAAIIEVAVAYGDKGAVASVITPQSEFRLVKGGLYRFDVDAAKTVALVRKGKLAVPQPDAQPTKDSEWVAVSNGQSRTMVVGTAIKEGKKNHHRRRADEHTCRGQERRRFVRCVEPRPRSISHRRQQTIDESRGHSYCTPQTNDHAMGQRQRVLDLQSI
jgi:hypothetical protein